MKIGRGCVWCCLVLSLLLPCAGRAEEAPVSVRTPEENHWVGQRVPFFVEVRAPGPFVGTVNFDMPNLPGVLVVKIGGPVVGSEERAGQSWFTQIHEFALFSQTDGSLEVPACPVRYGYQAGIGGPEQDADAQVPAWSVDIRRPPGSEEIGFLITTESLDVTETWEPAPGPVDVGAMFKRTIVQRATRVSGMALVPAPTAAPDEVRTYVGDAEVEDQFHRGAFLGERRETITYLMQQPGTLSLPALRYVWWNPKTETLESKVLPAVSFEVSPSAAAGTPGTGSTSRGWWPGVLGTMLVGLGVWRRRQLAAGWQRGWRWLYPPERVAARRLLRACRGNDVADAEAAWMAWRNTQGAGFRPGPELEAALRELRRVRYGPEPGVAWNGASLASVFADVRAARKTDAGRAAATVLPLLNASP